MEPQHCQQQQQLPLHSNEDSSSSISGSKNSFLCRQSTTRWIPTTDQIRILKELYHNNGVRSPSADQIQRISARLRQYGKIEGKNVFYWFQNHKARERQKKKFTADHHHPLAAASSSLPLQMGGGGMWKPAADLQVPPNKYTTKMGYSQPISSPPVAATGQLGSIGCFKEPSFTPKGGGSSAGWTGAECLPPHFAHIGAWKSLEPLDPAAADVETLPLFPVTGGEGSRRVADDGFCDAKPPHAEGFCSGWCLEEEEAAAAAALELRLNSYAEGAPNVTWASRG